MKKKREMRKLALQAERIREFTTQDLQAVVGGVETTACRLTGSCSLCGAGGCGPTD